MKISLYNLIQVLTIEDKLSTQKLPIKVAYRLSKIFSRAREEANFYQEKLLEILKNYGEKDCNGEIITSENGNVSIQKDKIDECSKELSELQNLELEIPDYSISLDSLETVKISLDEISVLLPFICEK